MPVEEQLATIFEVIEGGVETTAEVIPFPADAGATALEGTNTAVQLGNGVATEVSQLTVLEGGANTTAGVGLLAMDVGTVGLAIAPALGIIAGVGLYNLAPDFWTNVADKLTEAGQTVGGKVRAFLNGTTKQAGFSKETIEIFKEAFREAGLFELQPDTYTETAEAQSYLKSLGVTATEVSLKSMPYNITRENYNFNWKASSHTAPVYCVTTVYSKNNPFDNMVPFFVSKAPFTIEYTTIQPSGTIVSSYESSKFEDNIYYLYITGVILSNKWLNIISPLTYFMINNEPLPVLSQFGRLAKYILLGNIQSNNPGLQPDATYPTTNPFPTTYPSWTPWTLPEGLPEIYPVELPVINPDATQETAQSPEEMPYNDDLLEWLMDNFPQPEPIINPEPSPTPDPDPDPQPEPDPIPEAEPEETDPNPVDPNPTPTPSPLPIIPDLPDTVESNAMFTVYKPSMAQVNAFGGWLWSTDIVEQIKRIWQNPLDGIISFMKVYVDAPTSGSDTIKVGVLDSGVSSPVVSGQFITVECGSLNVSEKFYNATDYSPFVSMHLYLPFIGIVELDIDEFMSGEIKVTYHVDVYTGTCLAEVKSRRSPDMPEWTIVYTFSGNASQQLPLTSAEFSGALSSLVGVVGGGLAVASGGGLGLLAGASGIAHAVSHEMVHLAHSGSLSANAGIMGARTPYLILTRRRSYDANGYSEMYGYPSNKTVFLNNCSGYVKVKDIRLETGATDSERLEIINLLKAGVII